MLFYDWVSLLSFSLGISGVVALGGARDRKRLQNALFDNYMTSVRPYLDYGRPTNVTAKLHVATILGLDMKNQLLSIGGFFSFKWTDELLRWNPDEYAGIKDIVVGQDMIWKPDLAIYNSVEDDLYVGDESVLVEVTSKGDVRWEPGINLRVSCKVDIFEYPFEENVCSLQLTVWMNDNNSVLLWPEASPISLTGMVSNSQFRIMDQGALSVCNPFAEKFYCTVSFLLKLKRRPAYLAMTFLTPVTLLAVLCVVSFLLTPEEPEKVSVAITILLSFTVFLGVINTDLPETSDSISLIVVYVDTLLLLSFLSVVGNTMVIVIHRRDLRAAEDLLDIEHKRDLRVAASDPFVMDSYRRGDPKKTIASDQSAEKDEKLPRMMAQLNNSDCLNGPEKDNGESVVSGDQVSRDVFMTSRRKLTRAEKLNSCFFTLNIIALLTVICVIGVIIMT